MMRVHVFGAQICVLGIALLPAALLCDGAQSSSYGGIPSAIATAQTVKDMGITIFAVGFGGASASTMRALSAARTCAEARGARGVARALAERMTTGQISETRRGTSPTHRLHRAGA